MNDIVKEKQLNEVLYGLDYIGNKARNEDAVLELGKNNCKLLLEEIERLHSIIKEAREYLPKLRRSTSYELDEKIDDLEEILDKVGETNDSTRNV